MSSHPNVSALDRAAADNDALAEEYGIERVVGDLGINLPDLRYIAEQRALRAVLVRHGRIADLKRYNEARHPKGVLLTDEERAEIDALIPVYMDGITLGARWAQRRMPDFGIGKDSLRS